MASIMFSRRSAYIDSSAIRRVFDLASRAKDPINFSIGQPDFPVPDRIKEAVSAAMRDNRTAYTQTQGLLSFREQIAEKFTKENHLLPMDGKPLGPENILVSSGVSAILYLLFAVLADQGDEIILTDPYFLIYQALASYFQLRVRYVREDHLNEDLETELNQKTRFFLFSSPSNPTGKILNRGVLSETARILAKYGVIAIADEIYEKFDYENQHFSLGSIYPETITLNGFSKAYAMTGLRLGYVAARAEIIHRMATIQQYTFVCAPHPVQVAGSVALQTDISGHIREYRRRRDRIYQELSGVFSVDKPDGAFYIFPSLPESFRGNDESFVERAIEHNVLVVPGHIFSGSRRCFRISYAVPDEKLRAGAAVLRELALQQNGG